MKTFSVRLFIAFFILIISNISVFSQKGTEYIKIKNAYDLRHTDVITVSDFSAVEMGLSDINSVKVKYAKVQAFYGRDEKTDVFGSDWIYKVNLNITDSGGNVIGQKELVLETGQKSTYVTAVKLKLPLGSDIVKYNIESIAVTKANDTKSNSQLFETNSPSGVEWIRYLLPEDIRVEFSIETVTHYFFDASLSNRPMLSLDASNVNYSSEAGHTADLNWDFKFGDKEYELQIGFVDANHTNYENLGNFTDAQKFENAITINTTQNWYSPDVIYPKGTLYFRVRAVGRYIYGVGENFSKVKLGSWSDPVDLIITKAFEGDRNWELSQTFAEDGKRKAVITYYDQSLRSRQIQTNLSSEEAVLVAENKYDHEGRSAISILPTPAIEANGELNNKLFYKNGIATDANSGFNLFDANTSYEKRHFDKSDVNNPLDPNNFASPLSNGANHGAAGYYGENNELNSIHNDLIPNSNGFPLTQTRYSKDGTGRIVKQGGVGSEFQVTADGKSTNYLYGSANNTELQRLFGSNVGDAKHYKKNIVIDANGQVSVSYLDQAGRVIATALSQEGPDVLEKIYDIDNDVQHLTVDLKGHHDVDKPNKISTLDYTFLFDKERTPNSAVPYIFNYDLNGANQTLTYGGQNFCKTCKYRLTLRVFDPNGIMLVPTGGDLDISSEGGILIQGNDPCFNESYQKSYSLEVGLWQIGEYRVTKSLELISDPFELSFLEEAGVIPDKDALRDLFGVNNQINPLECIVVCDQCAAILTQYPNNPDRYKWYAECIGSKCPCETCETEITLSPDPNFTGVHTTICEEACSAQLTLIEDLYQQDKCSGLLDQITTQISPGGNFYEDPSWLKDNQAISEEYSTAEIRASWNQESIDYYVTKHREYCHYTYCTNNIESDKFNRKLAGASETWSDLSWLQIKAKLIADPDLNGFLINQTTNSFGGIDWTGDPFFAALSTDSDRRDEMSDFINMDINTTGNNAVGLVDFININLDNNVDPNINPGWTPVEKWNVLVGLYINAKSKVEDNYKEFDLGCSFFDDPNSLVSRSNPAPLDVNDIKPYVGNEFAEACHATCDANVENWMAILQEQCPVAYNLPSNQADWEEVRSLLAGYCFSGCNAGINPLGIINPDIGSIMIEGVTVDVAPEIWSMLTAAESLIDGMFDGADCPDDPQYPAVDPPDPEYPHGLLHNITGDVSVNFESGVTYTYTPFTHPGLVGVDGPQFCEPCDIIKNHIDFGEWILLDENTNNYVWSPGYWDIEGLQKILNTSSNFGLEYPVYNLTPFHVIDAMKKCFLEGYKFHDANTDCHGTTFYYDRLESYMANFLGCPGIWDISGLNLDHAGPSICDIPDFGSEGGNIVQEAMNKIDQCAFDNTHDIFWEGPQDVYDPSSINLEAFNQHFNTNMSAIQVDYIFKRGPVDCTIVNGLLDCWWPTFQDGQDLLNDLDNIPCSNITVTVTGVDVTGVPIPTYDETAFVECIEELTDQLNFDFEQFYLDQLDGALTTINNSRVEECFDPTKFNENLTFSYSDLEYQYTLYYYDQAGNLVQTVPPEGVKRLPDSDFPNGVWNMNSEPPHTMVTRYQYNSLNQVIAQSTPETRHPNGPNGLQDGSIFIYDNLGRLRFSRDAQQSQDGLAAYTKYDNLGRVIEVGEFAIANSSSFEENLKVSANIPSFPLEADYSLTEVIKTNYDNSGLGGALFQENLRNRVASTENDDIITRYSYDAHGNVKKLQHELKDIAIPLHQRYFTTEYDYDLISGNVNKVSFQDAQKGLLSKRKDRFYHKYEYDADNRLTHVHTSKDGLIWNNDARYFYYLHGPMARVELGEDKVQGLDYFYSLQGWIKGVNETAIPDPGLDGVAQSNSMFCKDQMGYRLKYFNTDYRPINNENIYANEIVKFTPGSAPLYNGNISAMETNIPYFNNGLVRKGLMRTNYRYDQLHRIKNSATKQGTENIHTFAFGPKTGVDVIFSNEDDYNTAFVYDKNGNLQFLDRNGPSGKVDDLSYEYFEADKRNLLKTVNDDPSSNGGVEDQANNNYEYDRIGNLTRDIQGQVSKIEWNLQGKVDQIDFEPGASFNKVEYTYDAAGNRLSKTTYNVNNIPTTTYYIRDAQGNILANYGPDKNGNNLGGITQKEVSLYGSARIGVQKLFDRAQLNFSPSNPNLDVDEGDRGNKSFELSNHLGNVLAVVSDKKLGYSDGSTATNFADYYSADVISANDYYPFGMAMPERSFDSPKYRYGFNGKEKDESGEWGSLTHYDYGFRIYNPGIARFLSVDPLKKEYPMLTPYQFAGNTPIWAIDRDGLESEVYIDQVVYGFENELITTHSYHVLAETSQGYHHDRNVSYDDYAQPEKYGATGILYIQENVSSGGKMYAYFPEVVVSASKYGRNLALQRAMQSVTEVMKYPGKRVLDYGDRMQQAGLGVKFDVSNSVFSLSALAETYSTDVDDVGYRAGFSLDFKPKLSVGYKKGFSSNKPLAFDNPSVSLKFYLHTNINAPGASGNKAQVLGGSSSSLGAKVGGGFASLYTSYNGTTERVEHGVEFGKSNSFDLNFGGSHKVNLLKVKFDAKPEPIQAPFNPKTWFKRD